jgi:hypothetical protein
MAYILRCINPMHGHARGSEVRDPVTVERLIATHNHHFVKVEVPDPEPDPVKASFMPAPDAPKPAK